LLVVAGLSLALSFTSGAFLGFFGLSTSVFAGYHGFMFQDRVVKRALAGDEVYRISDFALFLFSILLGAAATIAGFITFAGTCVPATLLAYSATGMQGDFNLGIVLIWVVCGGIAIFAVGWLIRWFVPRRPANT
jgi:hypothetical protein